MDDRNASYTARLAPIPAVRHPHSVNLYSWFPVFMGVTS